MIENIDNYCWYCGNKTNNYVNSYCSHTPEKFIIILNNINNIIPECTRDYVYSQNPKLILEVLKTKKSIDSINNIINNYNNKIFDDIFYVIIENFITK